MVNRTKNGKYLSGFPINRFQFFKTPDMKTLGTNDAAVSTAVNGWRLALTGRFRLLDQWCAFVQVIGLS